MTTPTLKELEKNVQDAKGLLHEAIAEKSTTLAEVARLANISGLHDFDYANCQDVTLLQEQYMERVEQINELSKAALELVSLTAEETMLDPEYAVQVDG